MFLAIGSILVTCIAGLIYLNKKKDPRVQRTTPLPTAAEILSNHKPIEFPYYVFDLDYKGSHLQALFSDILIFQDKQYLLGIESTTTIRIYTLKDIKNAKNILNDGIDFDAILSKLPQTTIVNDLFSMAGKEETKPLREKLIALQSVLEALYKENQYTGSPLELYTSKFKA